MVGHRLANLSPHQGRHGCRLADSGKGAPEGLRAIRPKQASVPLEPAAGRKGTSLRGKACLISPLL